MPEDELGVVEEIGHIGDGATEGLLARLDAMVAVFHLHDHALGAAAAALEGAPDLFGQGFEVWGELVGAAVVGGEGGLGGDRLADAVGLDGLLVDATGDVLEVGAALAEGAQEQRAIGRREIGAGVEAEGLHLGGRRRSDAVELADWQRGEQGDDLLRADHREAIGLVHAGGQFGQEAPVRDAGRGRQLRGGPDIGLDGPRDADRLLPGFGGSRHVQVGLVERERLDHGCVAREHLPDLRRDGLVDLEARRHEYELRAALHGDPGGQRRVNPEGACLVAGRRDHPARRITPDGQRATAQGGIVALLDGGEEGIHVDVEDEAGDDGNCD